MQCLSERGINMRAKVDACLENVRPRLPVGVSTIAPFRCISNFPSSSTSVGLHTAIGHRRTVRNRYTNSASAIYINGTEARGHVVELLVLIVTIHDISILLCH